MDKQIYNLNMGTNEIGDREKFNLPSNTPPFTIFSSNLKQSRFASQCQTSQ